MPFRCKCGRTFEKIDTFGSHTSGCAPFHHRRISSTSDISTMTKVEQEEQQQKHNNKRLSIQTDPLSVFNQQFILLSPTTSSSANHSNNTLPSSPSPQSAPILEGYRGFMMPTALSIQNTFEGVSRRRSMSTTSTAESANTAAAFK